MKELLWKHLSDPPSGIAAEVGGLFAKVFMVEKGSVAALDDIVANRSFCKLLVS